MGREQGDELGDEVVYVATIDGVETERPAYTSADHVNLQARGWVPRDRSRRVEGQKPNTPKNTPAQGSNTAASGAENNAEGGRS